MLQIDPVKSMSFFFLSFFLNAEISPHNTQSAAVPRGKASGQKNRMKKIHRLQTIIIYSEHILCVRDEAFTCSTVGLLSGKNVTEKLIMCVVSGHTAGESLKNMSKNPR